MAERGRGRRRLAGRGTRPVSEPAWMTGLLAGVGLLFVALAVPLILRRVPPNALYGLRVRATFADDDVWYEANVRSARGLLVIGILMAALDG